MTDSQEHQKKKSKNLELPSRDEQKQLQQMEILMRSNLIQLQSSELLSQVSATNKLSSKKITAWLESLEEDLLNSSHLSEEEISFSWANEQGYFELEPSAVDLKYCAEDEGLGTKITYKPPKKVLPTGSASHCSGTAPFYVVDVLVEMSTDLFNSKDILNYHYFNKRKLYLLALKNVLENAEAEAVSSKQEELQSEKKEKSKKNKKNNKRSKEEAEEEEELQVLPQKYKNFSIAFFKDDLNKPILQIQPAFSESILVRLIPVISESTFKSVQLKASKNNVRPKEWLEEVQKIKSGKSKEEMDPSSLPPTPFYNLSILEDMLMLLHHQILSKTIGAFPVIAELLVLFKVWLTQRDLRFLSDGFDGHQAALLLAYLIQTKRISTQSGSSPISLFQTLMGFLSSTKFNEIKLNFNSVNFEPKATAAISSTDKFHIKFGSSSSKLKKSSTLMETPLVLIHPIPGSNNAGNTEYNCMWRVSESSLNHLASEAKKSLELMQESNELNTFDQLFMAKKHFFDSCDCFYQFKVSNWESVLKAAEHNEMSDASIKRLTQASQQYPVSTYFADYLSQLIKQALGDRIHSVRSHIEVNTPTQLPTGSKIHSYPIFGDDELSYTISIGLVFNIETYFRRVDRGPAPTALGENNNEKTNQEFEQFRNFWGEKCQLRRFKDGSIVESVVWEQGKDRKVNSMIEEIIKYIVGLHLPCLPTPSSSSIFNRFQIGNVYPSKSINTSNANCLGAIEAFDEFSTFFVNNMKGKLPISFNDLAAITPELRYTSLYPPVKNPLVEAHLSPKNDNEGSNSSLSDARDMLKNHEGDSLSLLVPPIPIMANFESSGKWPTTALAVEKCKSAFLLRARSELLKLNIYSIIHKDTLDVCYKGYLFRLIPFSNFDVEKMIISTYEEDPDSTFIAKEATHKKWTIPPLHHNQVKSLHSKFPVFGEAVQLLQLWFAKHNFSSHICIEVLELLVAYEFVHPSSIHPPTTAFSAFHKALQRLVTHNWEEDPFIVDLSGESKVINVEARTSIVTRFRAARDSVKDVADAHLLNDINPAMYVVSSAEKINDFSPSYGSKTPEKVVLGIIINSARATLTKIKDLFENYFEIAEDEKVTSSSGIVDQQLISLIFESDAILNKCNYRFKFNKSIVNTNTDKGPLFARLQVFANTSTREITINNIVSV